MNRRSRAALPCPLLVAFFLISATPAAGQETVNEVLSFLLTNRSIPTEDFVGAAEAAAATRDTIAQFLSLELGTLPISSSASGFTYRLDRGLGTWVLTSESFGPFFTERTHTAGQGQLSFGVAYQHARFGTMDGRDLRDGSLVAVASRLSSEPQPFDVETLSLSLDTDTVTFASNYGLTDRVDVSVAVPYVRLSLSGERLDTYRDRQFLQARASISAAGLGDVITRVKYNPWRGGTGGIAVGAEARLPTGDEENLLGAGHASVQPRLMASWEERRVGVTGAVGYTFRELADEVDWAGAMTIVALPRLTIVGEVIGRRLESFGHLTETTAPHPQLPNVETTRLTSVPSASHRVVVVGGIKWNIARTWLINANVMRPLTSAGLNASWIPSVTFDYAFGR